MAYDFNENNLQFPNQNMDEEDEIEGLHKANFSFTCLIDRATTATINT